MIHNFGRIMVKRLPVKRSPTVSRSRSSLSITAEVRKLFFKKHDGRCVKAVPDGETIANSRKSGGDRIPPVGFFVSIPLRSALSYALYFTVRAFFLFLFSPSLASHVEDGYPGPRGYNCAARQLRNSSYFTDRGERIRRRRLCRHSLARLVPLALSPPPSHSPLFCHLAFCHAFVTFPFQSRATSNFIARP